MKLKSLLVLIIAIIIGGAVYYFSEKSGNELVKTNSYLISNLSKQLNDVTKLTIYEAKMQPLAIINKTEDKWIVGNRDGYEADISLIRKTFNNLAEAKIVEAKTSNPENYIRLGVEDIDLENAQGIQLTIEGLNKPINIIAGNKGTVGNNTQYVRRVGEEQSWLINKNLDIKKDATHWLKKEILDIPPERIKIVQIDHGDGNVITIENEGTKEYEFVLKNTIPEGKTVSESEIYQVANALSSLQLRDVASLDNINENSVQAIVTKYVTYDGLTVTVNSFTIEDETYSKIKIEFSEDNVDVSQTETDSESDISMYSDSESAQELVNNLNPKLAPWAFILPTITKDALIKKLDNFTMEEEGT